MDALSFDIRSRLSHFRILILGRANAGKTTILKKVCNSIDDPEIFSPDGQKVCISPSARLFVTSGSTQRGLHDIENQLIFKSNPQFIFHDSRGFESGSVEEFDRVKTFILNRAATGSLSEQLHAIWYCLPTDTGRPLLAADEHHFFTSGLLPLVAIFTKLDGLVTEANNKLRASGLSIKDARKMQTRRARELLQTDFLGPLQSKKYCPADYVQLDDMRKENSHCHDLIEKTANAINDKALRLLFVSVQQNNINVCIKYAITRRLIFRIPSLDMVKRTLSWFPHVWVRLFDNDSVLIHEAQLIP
ncbi:hypothetical protein R3P38DRAFT_2528891 [Favolaschia claudopus]|uniref:G domain-containing protein n=1 Tax=Favolaschia claudopus TaxID=2862362 RepID=A0AAW0BJU7_9AGAR